MLTANAAASAAGLGGSQNNDSYIDVAGDFGNVRMGRTDDALDLNDGPVGASMDLEGTGGPASGCNQWYSKLAVTPRTSAGPHHQSAVPRYTFL